MNRRQFMQVVAAALAAPAFAQTTSTAPSTSPISPSFQDQAVGIVQMLFAGFLRNAAATSKDYVVCDYPGGTKLKGCCTPSGKTYVSVARMLPALVESADPEHHRVLQSVFRHAFDPQHPDFWGYGPADKATQLSVEAALAAWSLWRMDKAELDALTSAERTNIQKWLASCTQVTERKTNHAWFTAINQAVRLQLSHRYPEFAGDEKWMLEDIAALDALYGESAEGWCSDSPDQPIYDFYNFYVFPNFPLLWGRVIGEKYPQQYEKFRARVRRFLESAPHFFAANGCHPLMGRSLIYRSAVLSPLVLGYQEKLWPHSPGLLKAIVRKQLDFHGRMGCFDEQAGKLRETYSREGTEIAREPYVDNGHPYWAMLGFEFLSLPESDPFWSADEEPLPVEKGDFLLRFEGPRFLLSGCKRSGEVRIMQAQNSAKRDTYRDKYGKFAWSSHFAFCALKDKDKVPFDQALVFRDLQTGACATRAPAGVTTGKLLPDGVETNWFAILGNWRFEVTTRVRWIGEFEERTHRIFAPAESLGQVEVIEGGYAIRDDSDERSHLYQEGASASFKVNAQNGTIGLWFIKGHTRVGSEVMENANLIHRKVVMKTAMGPIKEKQSTFASLHYASPNPLPREEVMAKGNELVKQWKE